MRSIVHERPYSWVRWQVSILPYHLFEPTEVRSSPHSHSVFNLVGSTIIALASPAHFINVAPIRIFATYLLLSLQRPIYTPGSAPTCKTTQETQPPRSFHPSSAITSNNSTPYPRRAKTLEQPSPYPDGRKRGIGISE